MAKFCMKCGTEINGSNTFCPRCGTKIQQQTPTSQQTTQTQPYIPPVKPGNKNKILIIAAIAVVAIVIIIALIFILTGGDILGNSDDSLSDEEKSLRTAQILKVDNIRSEFVNSIGRIKDPEGKRRSLVLTLGMKQEDLNFMLEQQTRYNISSPHLLQPILKGGLMRDSQFLIDLWFNEDLKELTRKNICDLPLLARILRKSQDKINVRLSEVLFGKTKVVKKVAKANYPILQHYGIRLRKIQGGYIFEKKN